MIKRHTKSKTAKADPPGRKERVTVTLSRGAADYVRTISVKERSHVSTVMERMIEGARHAQELRQLNADITAFYDALPDERLQDETAWSQAGTAGLASLVESETDGALKDRSKVGSR